MNKSISSSFLCLILVSFLSGCSIYHIDSNDTTSNYYPSKKTRNAVQYAERVNRPHEIIGTVTVNTERRQRMIDVIEQMKREAAILGGDAITDIKTDATGTWKKLPAQNVIGNAYVRANFNATVVAYK